MPNDITPPSKREKDQVQHDGSSQSPQNETPHEKLNRLRRENTQNSSTATDSRQREGVQQINSAIEPFMVVLTAMNLERLMSVPEGCAAVCELYKFCEDPSYKIRNDRLLKKSSLLNSNGLVHGDVKNIVLAIIKVEDSHLRYCSPLDRSKSMVVPYAPT
jgi:hypothetical protein